MPATPSPHSPTLPSHCQFSSELSPENPFSRALSCSKTCSFGSWTCPLREVALALASQSWWSRPGTELRAVPPSPELFFQCHTASEPVLGHQPGPGSRPSLVTPLVVPGYGDKPLLPSQGAFEPSQLQICIHSPVLLPCLTAFLPGLQGLSELWAESLLPPALWGWRAVRPVCPGLLSTPAGLLMMNSASWPAVWTWSSTSGTFRWAWKLPASSSRTEQADGRPGGQRGIWHLCPGCARAQDHGLHLATATSSLSMKEFS